MDATSPDASSSSHGSSTSAPMVGPRLVCSTPALPCLLSNASSSNCLSMSAARPLAVPARPALSFRIISISFWRRFSCRSSNLRFCSMQSGPHSICAVVPGSILSAGNWYSHLLSHGRMMFSIMTLSPEEGRLPVNVKTSWNVVAASHTNPLVA